MENYTPNIPQKQCIGKCQQLLPATPEFFSRDKNRKDGLHPECKSCKKEYKKQHYQSRKNEILAKNKAYRESHKDQVREQKREYYQENKEHLNERKKHHYEQNKERILEH